MTLKALRASQLTELFLCRTKTGPHVTKLVTRMLVSTHFVLTLVQFCFGIFPLITAYVLNT